MPWPVDPYPFQMWSSSTPSLLQIKPGMLPGPVSMSFVSVACRARLWTELFFITQFTKRSDQLCFNIGGHQPKDYQLDRFCQRSYQTAGDSRGLIIK